MSAMPPTNLATPAEYLSGEETALEKHEWIDGQIVAMAGGSLNHSLIISNTIRSIGNRLAGKPCRVLDSNIRVRVATAGLYTYPDVTVFCGEPEFDPLDRTKGTLLNPRVIVEVLSPSTEAYDRGNKFKRYLSLGSLQEYVLVSQDEPFVQVLARREDGIWTISSHDGMDAIAKLASLGVDLPLNEVYAGVEFPPANPGA